MKIERTRDMGAVARIIRNPKIWGFIHDDGVTELIEPQDSENIHWLMATDDGAEVGVFMVYPTNFVCYEMHTCILPEYWGGKSNEAAQKLLEYVFNVMGAMKIISLVPESNKKALRFALKNGMKEEGLNRSSFMKNGVLEGQIMVGITIKEWKSCQQ